METGDYSDTRKFVSSPASDSKVQQNAELGVMENLPKSEKQIFTREQHIEHQPEDFLFGGGVHKDKHLPFASDINQFILHESRANVPTNKEVVPASTSIGQSIKASKNEDSSASEKSQEYISDLGAGDSLSNVTTESSEQIDTLKVNEVPDSGETINNVEGKCHSSGNPISIESNDENLTSKERRGKSLAQNKETKGSMRSNTQTDKDLVKESTEMNKTDNEETRTLNDNIELRAEDHLSSEGQNNAVVHKEAVGSSLETENENVEGSGENKSDSFVYNERSEIQIRTESDRPISEKHKEFVSHEVGKEELDERKQQNKLEDNHTDFIHSEQVVSVEEEKESAGANELKSEEKQEDPKASTPDEQGKSDSDDADRKISELPVSKDETQDEWLDILGSGQLKKKIIKKAENDYRPQNLHVCEINLEGHLEDGTVVEKFENLKIQIGDVEVIQGIDLALPLMNVGEVALLEIGPRFAYGKLGRSPDIPADATLVYTVELLGAENEPDLESLSIAERKEIGHKKRERGNWWFSREEYSFAIQSYRRAIEFLDEAEGGFSMEKEVSEDAEKKLQELLEDRLKVFNNLAAAQMKIKAYDAALTSVENVLRCQPQNVKALFRKGKILAAKGDKTAALSILRSANQLEPDSKAIKQEMQRLLDVIKHDTKQEKSLYKKMLGQDKTAEKASSKGSKISYRTWGIVCSSVAVVLLGAVAYRYKFL